MILLDGKKVADNLLSEMKEVNKDRKDNKPVLVVFSVGDDPASKIYVRNKERACEEAGVEFRHYSYPDDVEMTGLRCDLYNVANFSDATGVILQLPVPNHLDKNELMKWIPPQRDVDGFSFENIGRMYSGRESSFHPCTPEGIMMLLRWYKVPISGKHAVVIGRSNIVGKPMALELLNADATVTVCHSHTQDFAKYTRDADILVSAVGKPKLITADMVKPGAAVIDVGMNRVNGHLCGDVDFDSVKEVAGWLTPVPGGVGPMTVATLISHC